MLSYSNLGMKLNLQTAKNNPIDPDKLKYGLSPLHALIRSMDMFLKIANRLAMEKPCWRVSKSNEVVKERQAKIKTEFQKQLGLRISEPLPSGGNSNDGNTARRFFAAWKTVSNITGLDEGLLEHFHIILSTINSRADINVEAFQTYAEETRQLYNKLYSWYAMTPTVHKLLVHGGDVIEHALLPIGMLSEEAQETRNKCIRNFREHHARQFSRVANLEDVFNRLLITSDPVISLMTKKFDKAREINLPEKAVELIKKS